MLPTKVRLDNFIFGTLTNTKTSCETCTEVISKLSLWSKLRAMEKYFEGIQKYLMKELEESKK